MEGHGGALLDNGIKRDFLQDSRQKIEELWKMVHKIQSSDNLRMTLHDMYAPPVGLDDDMSTTRVDIHVKICIEIDKL